MVKKYLSQSVKIKNNILKFLNFKKTDIFSFLKEEKKKLNYLEKKNKLIHIKKAKEKINSSRNKINILFFKRWYFKIKNFFNLLGKKILIKKIKLTNKKYSVKKKVISQKKNELNSNLILAKKSEEYKLINNLEKILLKRNNLLKKEKSLKFQKKSDDKDLSKKKEKTTQEIKEIKNLIKNIEWKIEGLEATNCILKNQIKREKSDKTIKSQIKSLKKNIKVTEEYIKSTYRPNSRFEKINIEDLDFIRNGSEIIKNMRKNIENKYILKKNKFDLKYHQEILLAQIEAQKKGKKFKERE
jgi:hypothetical protein